MQVNIDRISMALGASITCSFSQMMNAFEYLHEEWSFIGPVLLEVACRNIGEKAFEVAGELQAEICGTCSRCLNPVTIPMEIGLCEQYAPVWDDQQPDRFLYQGNVLNLDEMVYHLILLNIPLQVLCKPDCEGIDVNK